MLFILHLSFQNYGQENKISGKDRKKNYCDWSGCTLTPDNPAHFDPYYNGHLCENFNPMQIDFSREYFELQIARYATRADNLKQVLKFNFSNIWQTGNNEQNGVLGANYQRIRIHIDKVNVAQNRDTYFVIGASNVANNVYGFKGTIRLLKVFLFDSCHDSRHKGCGELFAEYIFHEDSLQNYSGVYKGIMECSFFIDSASNNVVLDESADAADGYWNRTFVGTWKQYKAAIAKKCIWGDYRLPFTFDFDCGDGEMIVRDKYKRNGWQNFGDGSEFIRLGEDSSELKNKWWKLKN